MNNTCWIVFQIDGPAKHVLHVSSRSSYTVTDEDIYDVTKQALYEFYDSLPSEIKRWISVAEVLNTYKELQRDIIPQTVQQIQSKYTASHQISYTDVNTVKTFLSHAIISPLDKGRGLLCIC